MAALLCAMLVTTSGSLAHAADAWDELLDAHVRVGEAQLVDAEQAVFVLPDWMAGRPVLGPSAGLPDPDDLAWYVEHGDEPWIRAYAALCLSAYGVPDHADVVAPLLDDHAMVYPMPRLRVRQLATAPTQVHWHGETVAEIAQRCMRDRLLGIPFETLAQYLQWREPYPELRSTVEYWEWALAQARSSAAPPEQLPALLMQLESRSDVGLVALITGEVHSRPIRELEHVMSTEDEIVQRALREIGSERLMAVLRDEDTLPGFETPRAGDRHRRAFRAWAMSHAGELFGPGAGPTFMAWWEEAVEAGDADTPLVLAAARLNPRARATVLQRSIEGAGRYERRAEMLAELIRCDHSDSWPFLRDWFWQQAFGKDLMSFPRDTCVIIRSLGDQGEPGLAALGELLTDPRFDAVDVLEVQALAHALQRVDPELRFPKAHVLDLARGKGAGLRHADSPAGRARKAELDAAAADCIARARAWWSSR